MPAPDPRRQPGARAALLEQLRYLIVEADALRHLLSIVPPAVLTAQPLGEPTVLQQLAGLARLDRDVRLPRLAQLLEQHAATLEDAPELVPAGDGPPAGALTDVLDDVIAAREELVGQFEALSDEQWDRTGRIGDETVTVAEMAFAISHEDVEVLRRLTARMQEARLSDRA